MISGCLAKWAIHSVRLVSRRSSPLNWFRSLYTARKHAKSIEVCIVLKSDVTNGSLCVAAGGGKQFMTLFMRSFSICLIYPCACTRTQSRSIYLSVCVSKPAHSDCLKTFEFPPMYGMTHNTILSRTKILPSAVLRCTIPRETYRYVYIYMKKMHSFGWRNKNCKSKGFLCQAPKCTEKYSTTSQVVRERGFFFQKRI